MVEITLIWEPNKEPYVTGYKIYYGRGVDFTNNSIDVGNVTEYTMKIDKGIWYSIAATAYDSHDNESDYSKILIVNSDFDDSSKIIPASGVNVRTMDFIKVINPVYYDFDNDRDIDGMDLIKSKGKWQQEYIHLHFGKIYGFE
jgi:hypothetical protein